MAAAASALAPDVVVAVIGTGTMGSGIAAVAAAAGHRVLLYDALPGAADAGVARQGKDLEKLVARGKLSAGEAQARRSRMQPVEKIEALAPAGLVIEAILEDLDVKVKVLRAVEAVVAPGAIFGTNTSSLSVTAIAAKLQRPGRLVGMHFFNPAPILPLVEVVSGRLTDPTAAEITHATARRWGKIPVRCASTPGFIVNRVARPFYGEALPLASQLAASPATLDAILREVGGFRMGPFALIEDAPGMAVLRTVAMLVNEAVDAVHLGIAAAEDVDLSMVNGVNYPVGPLAWGDRIGPARIVAAIDALARICGEDRDRVSPLLRRRAQAGLPLQEKH